MRGLVEVSYVFIYMNCPYDHSSRGARQHIFIPRFRYLSGFLHSIFAITRKQMGYKVTPSVTT